MNNSKTIMVTGGHMTPALAVIAELQKQGFNQFAWVGQKYNQTGATSTSPEFNTVSNLPGVSFYNLRGGKLVRTFYQSPKEFLAASLNLVRIPWGIIKAFILVGAIRPGIVVSFGGFLALPIVLAARVWGIKAITHEQTVVVGLANRIIGKLAQQVLISWPSSAKYFAPHKSVLTGNPIREEVFVVKSDQFNFPNSRPILYVTGGNQGAVFLNRLIWRALPMLLTKVNVIHQTGNAPQTLAALKELSLSAEQQACYVHTPYVYPAQIGEVLHKASLVAARSGANTVIELLALGKMAIYVPLPNTAQNEQVLNAQTAAATGLALVIEQHIASPQNLIESIDLILSAANKNQDLLGKDIAEAKQWALEWVRPDAAKLVANQVIKLLNA